MSSLRLEAIDAPATQPLSQGPSTAAEMPDVNESAMGRLRKRYAQLDDGVELFTIPTYGELMPNGELFWPFVGRYERLEPDEIGEIRTQAEQSDNPKFMFGALVLVESCVELGVRGKPTEDDPDGPFEPLATPGTAPVRWDQRLADGLGFHVDAPDSLLAIEVLKGAFKNNLQAVNEHSADVYMWMLYGRAAALSEDEEDPGKG